MPALPSPSRRAWFLLGVFVGVLLSAAGIVLLLRSGALSSQRRAIIDAPAVVEQVRRLNQLVTVRYVIQKVVALEEKKVPIGAEKILLFVHAEVSAGIDLNSLTERDVIRLPTGGLILRLPAPRITSIAIDEQQTKVWDRRITWWTPWVPFNPDLERQARLAARKSIEDAALEMRILEEAERNAHTAIRSLLATVGIDTVNFPSS